jgi:hypothetical protein
MNSPVERSANIWANRREQHPVLGIVYVFTPPALAMFVDSLPKPELAGHFLENFGGEGYWHQCKQAMPGMTEPLYRLPVDAPKEPSQYGSAELQAMIVSRACEKDRAVSELSDQKINDLVVEYATAVDQLAELGRYVDYDPDVGRVPEHWVADPLIVAAVKYVLAALDNK